MAIAADPFAPPKAIGQGLTPIAEPDYASSSGGSASVGGAENAAAGPFSESGALGSQADANRSGLAQILSQTKGGDQIDTASLGLPQLGGSPVSTAGVAATPAAASSAPSSGGLSRLFGDSGGDAGPGPVGGPTPASEGGRAFGAGSPFSGLTGTGINTGTALANIALGLPGIMGFGGVLGVPMGVARGAEALANYSFNVPSNNENSPVASALADLQAAIQGILGTTPTLGSPNFGFNPDANAALAAQRSGERGQPPGVEDLSDAGNNPTGIGVGPGTGVGGGPGPGAGGSNPSGEGQGGPDGGGTPGSGEGGPGSGAPGDGPYGRGGLVPNRHPGPGDDEPAMLTGGEFVVRAPAVKRIGLGRLMAENRKGL